MVQDRKDAQILALLQTNCRLTAEQIGDKIGLSPTAVTRRIKRLRESGMIEAEVAVRTTRSQSSRKGRN